MLTSHFLIRVLYYVCTLRYFFKELQNKKQQKLFNFSVKRLKKLKLNYS